MSDVEEGMTIRARQFGKMDSLLEELADLLEAGYTVDATRPGLFRIWSGS